MAHRQALENRLFYIHRQMELGTDYPLRKTTLMAIIMDMMQERKATRKE
ncbi:hypothetical protein [Acinetobacter pragensis]